MSGSPTAPGARSVPADSAASARMTVGLTIAGCAVGLVLRWLASQTDPWLDEVWSFELLPRMLGPSDVLFELHHSNNHPLNTLFLYWLGDGGADFWWYRLHTMVAGVATIAVAVAIAARRGVPEAAFASLLFATSFIAVHHSSQARGYALMLFGALAAFHALQRHHDRPTLANTIAYGAAIAWALFSNLYALTVVIGLSLWSLARTVEREGSVRAAFLPLLRLHALPAIALGIVIWVFYLPGLSGTQFVTHRYGIVVQAFSLLLGGPFVGPAAEAAMGAGIVALGVGLFVLRADRDREWLAYALVIVGAPALVIAVTQPKALFVRFFAAAEMFLLLLVAFGLGWLFRARRAGVAGPIAALVLAGGMVWGNLQHIDRLLEAGRGQYGAAFRYMADETFGGAFVVASDHNFGTAMMVRFFDRFVPGASIGFSAEEDPRRPPEWFVRVGHPRPPEFVYADQLYGRDRAFPGGGFGFDWQLYRRVPLGDALRRRGVRE